MQQSLVVSLALVVAAFSSWLDRSADARVLVVTQSPVSYSHYASIQTAVDASAPGDWIMIDAGVYNEAVYITTPGIHLRGIDRNRVVVDGQHQVGNGIEVWKADGVSIENLTVHDFDRATLDAEDGNEVWWNGGDGSGEIGIHGWLGRYLTTYDTGLLGGYGIFMSNSVSGMLDQVYASGFNDSGLYLGACRDCQARIAHALIENNALGYSGTNSGGRIVVEDSIFRHNSNGVGPNSLNNDDKPPPQDGACDSGSNTSDTPVFASTAIARCTVFRNNLIESNDNFSTPANSTTASIPWGNGVILIGTYADLIDGNDIRDNPSAGILGLENPDPFPPTADTVYFQLSGNAIVNNTFSGNGGPATPYNGDITLAGGVFGQKLSVNNCVSNNHPAKSFPADIEGTWGCQNLTTPNPGGDPINWILELQAASQARTSVAQPVPPAQATMPNPCAGVPANPLCSRFPPPRLHVYRQRLS
ncbi:MAG TPA: hypothetical protein VEI94_00495 [Candidatus Bathyarchaeia archaeon]|nr:hypothetical protein [Candidatus Bathyarchaeia archaeon]